MPGPAGANGKDGLNGKDGKDGEDGVSVTDARIDFDGSLIIALSTGREINVGEVMPLELSERIKVITNGGGTSQGVLDTLASLQAQIDALGPPTGTVSVNDGTAAAPSINNIGDTNTGIYFPAEDTIAFTEGGVESMRIDSSGNVGIGTNAPDSRLDVRDAVNTSLRVGRGSGQGNVTIYGPSGTNSASFLHNGSGLFITQTGGTSGFLFRNTDGDYTFSTGSGNTERVRITSAGLVGIGTNAPVGRLHAHASSGNTVIQITNATGELSTNGMSLIVGAGGEASIYQRENNYLRFVYCMIHFTFEDCQLD
jgi:hypothetical protein